MKYGDKRDKDLNTNEEGLKYAVDTSNAYCDLNKELPFVLKIQNMNNTF